MAPTIDLNHKTEGYGQYVSKPEYKYDIIDKRVVERVENLPKCFLADTLSEAEKTYKDFESILNMLAKGYAASTGIDAADLFREGLVGLAKAKKTWDCSRSEDFKIYAIYRIKDALSEAVRKNIAPVVIPSYIKKAHYSFVQIMEICCRFSICPSTVLNEQQIPDVLPENEAVSCYKLVLNIIKAAERAKVPYLEFIDRISILPSDVIYDEQMLSAEVHHRQTEKMEAAMVVDKLKEIMTPEELYICEGIMLDKSFDVIGKEMGKSKGWVSLRLKDFRIRILQLMEEEAL